MRLLRDHVEIRLGLSKLGPEPESVEDSKMDWETKQADKMRQQQQEETGEMITYSRELVDRQWRSGDGTVSSVWRPRSQLHVPDTVAPETTFSGYSKQIIPESQLPPVHVKKEKKVVRQEHHVPLVDVEKARREPDRFEPRLDGACEPPPLRRRRSSPARSSSSSAAREPSAASVRLRGQDTPPRPSPAGSRLASRLAQLAAAATESRVAAGVHVDQRPSRERIGLLPTPLVPRTRA